MERGGVERVKRRKSVKRRELVEKKVGRKRNREKNRQRGSWTGRQGNRETDQTSKT